MKPFYVEGMVIRSKGLRGNRKGKQNHEIEPFGQIFWAQTAGDALRMASESLVDGQWLEGPTVSEHTEEQRMRQLGAPLLPGFEPGKNKSTKSRRKKG